MTALLFLIAAAVLAVALGYGIWMLAAWLAFGHPGPPAGIEVDPILDRFIPYYDVVERHRVEVRATPAVTLGAAAEADLEGSPIVRAIIQLRRRVLGAVRPPEPGPRGLVVNSIRMGWGLLAEVPGRELVLGAVTRPWEADVVFRSLPPDRFAAFNEPGFVKIVWTLRTEPMGTGHSLFLTETRAVATDAEAQRRFRWYWARFSAGIALIRWLLLRPVRRAAERHAGRDTWAPTALS